jgi:hypothetical protein
VDVVIWLIDGCYSGLRRFHHLDFLSPWCFSQSLVEKMFFFKLLRHMRRPNVEFRRHSSMICDA